MKVKMFLDNIIETIQKLHPSLSSIVHPQDIDGLTEFDRQQIIAATTKNDRFVVEIDKFLEIFGRRTKRRYASFATHLHEHVQQIHRSIQNNEKEQSLPSVTVGPSLVTNSSSNDLVQGCRATGNPPTLRTIFFSVDRTLMWEGLKR